MEQIFIISREVKANISREFCISKIKHGLPFLFFRKKHLKFNSKKKFTDNED